MQGEMNLCERASWAFTHEFPCMCNDKKVTTINLFTST